MSNKVTNRNLLSLPVLVLVITSCGGGGGSGGSGGSGGGGVTSIDPSTVNFTTQYFPSGKAIAPLPSGWEQLLFSDPEIISSFTEPAEGVNDQFRENIVIARVATGGVATPDGISNIQQVSAQTRIIDGITAQETIFDADVAGVPIDLRFMEITLPQDGFVFGLLYSAERSQFSRNVEIARYVADNMRVGRIAMSGFTLDSNLEDPGKTPIATDGNSFLIVSCRQSPDFPYPAELIGQLIGADREKIGGEILIQAGVDTGNTGCRFTRPEITFDGSNYLVTYMGPENGLRQILGRRISPAGSLLDNAPFNISNSSDTAQFAPAAVYTGSAHMVVWNDDDLAGTKRLLGALVSPDGSVSAPFTVFDDLSALYPQQVNAFVYRSYVALALDRVMVAIEPRFAFDVRQPERPIYAQILDLNGIVQLPSPLLVREDNGDNPRYVQVTSDSQSFLVTWVEGLLETNTISSGSFGIYGRQVGTDGQLINGDASSPGLEIQSEGNLPIEELNTSFIDGRYSLLWSSTSFGTNYGIYENTVSSDLASITSAAPVAGTRDVTVNNSMPRESTPDIAATIDTTLYVWSSRSGTIDVWRRP
ncbi:MAG: hypothetical protein ACR2Q3_08715 [Woeseiaceae bacterium]